MDVTIDAHVHALDPSRFAYGWSDDHRATMHREFSVDDAVGEFSTAGVGGCIMVQALDQDDETDWLLSMAGGGEVRGVVGWVDLASPSVAEVLDRRRTDPRLCGIRHRVALEPERDWLTRPSVTSGLDAVSRAGLAFDLLLRPDQLDLVPALVAAHPDLSLVLDHLGVPHVHPEGLEGWAVALARAAAYRTVSCKTSGLLAGAPTWPIDDEVLLRIGRIALDAFGPERLMFASDWPVSTLIAPYAETMRATRVAFDDLDGPGWRAVLSETARRVYRLDQGSDGMAP